MSASHELIGALMSEKKVAMTVRLVWLIFSYSFTLFCSTDGRHCLGPLYLVVPQSQVHLRMHLAAIGATIILPAVQRVTFFGRPRESCYSLFTSPLVGMALGTLIMKLVFEIFADWPPKKANGLFRLQVLSAAFMAYPATVTMTLRRYGESSRWP